MDPGRCAACSDPIEVGDLVVIVNDEVVHLECEDPESAIAKSQPMPFDVDDMPSQETLRELYPTVDHFADLMREELWRNRANGDRPGWLSMSPKQLFFEVSWHTGKLVVPLKEFDVAALREHAADIGNAAMFVLDYAEQGVPWEAPRG